MQRHRDLGVLNTHETAPWFSFSDADSTRPGWTPPQDKEGCAVDSVYIPSMLAHLKDHQPQQPTALYFVTQNFHLFRIRLRIAYPIQCNDCSSNYTARNMATRLSSSCKELQHKCIPGSVTLRQRRDLRCWFDFTEKKKSPQVPLTVVNCHYITNSTTHNVLFGVQRKF